MRERGWEGVWSHGRRGGSVWEHVWLGVILRMCMYGEVKDSVIFPFFLFFMSLITLYPPLVLPLAHLHELNTYVN